MNIIQCSFSQVSLSSTAEYGSGDHCCDELHPTWCPWFWSCDCEVCIFEPSHVSYLTELIIREFGDWSSLSLSRDQFRRFYIFASIADGCLFNEENFEDDFDWANNWGGQVCSERDCVLDFIELWNWLSALCGGGTYSDYYPELP